MFHGFNPVCYHRKLAMKASRRRKRMHDPLASLAAIRAICDQLRNQCPDIIPKSDKQLVSLLNALRHLERYPKTDSANGRPAKWEREILLKVAENLAQILARETSKRVSISSFVGLYLRVLHFPADLISALETGAINLQEATILARISHQKLAVSAAKALSIRRELIATHIKTQGSQNGLRERVKEILGETNIVSSETIAAAVQAVDELLKVDPQDKRHLFYEQFKDLFFALREIQPQEIDDNSLAEFSKLTDQLSTLIYSIKHKHKQRMEIIKRFCI